MYFLNRMNGSNGRKTFRCILCSVPGFDSAKKLVIHKKSVHGKDAKIKCIPCLKEYSYDASTYREHLLSKKHINNVKDEM